jgi:hypothetical protein
MPFSPLWAGVGLVVGVLATALAFEFGFRNVRNPEKSKLTSAWNLGEVSGVDPPRIMAEDVEGVRVPDGAKVLVRSGEASLAGGVLRHGDVRMHPDVRVNFAYGDQKALVFSGNVHSEAMAVSTANDTILSRLKSEFDRLWDESEPYVERVAIKDLAGRENVEVEVEGTVSQVMDYRGRTMIRVTDAGETVGVLAKGDDLESLEGTTVQVRGEFRREEGYHVIDADRIRTVSGSSSRPRTGRA